MWGDGPAPPILLGMADTLSRDLDVIRCELEYLVAKRFVEGLTRQEEHTYLRLATKEAELLGLDSTA